MIMNALIVFITQAGSFQKPHPKSSIIVTNDLYIITPAGTRRDLLSELINQFGQPCGLVLSHLDVLFNRDCLREGRERRCTIAYTSLAP